MSVTPEQERELRKEYPKLFRLQKRLFPEKKPDPREKDILKRIQAAIEKAEKAIADIKKMEEARHDFQQSIKSITAKPRK